MKKLAALSFGLLALAGCSSNTTTDANGLPRIEVKPYEKASGGAGLATVNGAEITSKELDERVNRSTFQSPSEVTPEKKKEFLEELISNEVLYQEAKAKGYSEHPRVKMMMVSLLQRDALGTTTDAAAISDADTKKYYDTHHDEYVIPEKVRARRIVIGFGADKSASRKKADEVRKQAAGKPEDFGKVAMESSEGPEKQRQGELGYFPSTGRPGLDQKIVSTAFGLKNGEVSQVFETAEGWNIVKVENRAPRSERNYEQVKKSIERKLMTERRKAMLDNYIAELKNKAKVAVNDQALASYTPAIQPKPQLNPGMMPGMPGGHPDIMGGGGNQPGQPIVVPPRGVKPGDDGHGHGDDGHPE